MNIRINFIKYLISLFNLILFLSVNGQPLERKLISSCSLEYSSPTLSVSSTLGETFITTLSNGDLILTQGFQQPVQTECTIELNGGLDTIAYCQSPILLFTENNFLSYLWSTGATTDSITVLPTQTTTYYLTGINGSATCKDSIVVVKLPGPFPYYSDLDNDGYGDSLLGQYCSQPAGSFTSSTDCNGSDSAVHPNAQEVCNGIDDNCDGIVDFGSASFAAGDSISGISLACVPATSGSTQFSLPLQNTSAHNFIWQVPSGMTIASGQGSNQLQVNWTATAVQSGIRGEVCVVMANACTTSAPLCKPVSLQIAAPTTPGSISGNAKLCPGDQVTFSVAAQPRADAYSWSLPGNMQVIQQNANTLTAEVLSGYTGGVMQVTAQNACGTSGARTKTLYQRPPITPGTIAGLRDGLCLSNQSYSIAPVTGSDSYLWTIGSSGTFLGGQGSTGISVGFGQFTQSTLGVQSVNNCGISSVRSATLKGTPGYPSPISGNILPCTGTTQNYSISSVTGAQSYSWNSTSAGSIVQGAGTKSIQVTWSASPATNQALSVQAINACGTSSIRGLSGIQVVSCQRMAVAGGLSVYPVPAGDILNLRAGEITPVQLTIFNMMGKIVLSTSWRTELDLTTLANGIYILRVQYGDGSLEHLSIELNR